jgi:hypothetical protein
VRVDLADPLQLQAMSTQYRYAKRRNDDAYYVCRVLGARDDHGSEVLLVSTSLNLGDQSFDRPCTNPQGVALGVVVGPGG